MLNTHLNPPILSSKTIEKWRLEGIRTGASRRGLAEDEGNRSMVVHTVWTMEAGCRMGEG